MNDREDLRGCAAIIFTFLISLIFIVGIIVLFTTHNFIKSVIILIIALPLFLLHKHKYS